MADLKISALTAATTPLAGTEVLPIVQGGVTTKVAVSDLTAGRAVTASSVNKVAITAPATASTLTIADGKTLAVNDNATLGTGGLTLGNSGGFTAAASKVLTANNTLTLAGTDATTHTFPTTSATIARTDAAQTFTGDQSFSGNVVPANTKGIDFAAAGGGVFAYYEEYTAASAACTGAINTAAVWKLTKVGNVVTLTLPVVSGTATGSNAYFDFGTAIPAKYRPVADVGFIPGVQDNGVYAPASGFVFASGTIRIYRNVPGTGNFSGTSGLGVGAATTVSWTI